MSNVYMSPGCIGTHGNTPDKAMADAVNLFNAHVEKYSNRQMRSIKVEVSHNICPTNDGYFATIFYVMLVEQ